jgi:predicted nucleic acid-binding protein
VIVVSNASPIISLGAVGRLELLSQLFGEISIPRAVLEEVKSVDLRVVDWVIPTSLKGDFVPRALEAELDRGESEAIALAVELRADLLLMDERRGRQIASRFGLKLLGTLGVLVEAKRSGLLTAVTPVLNDLRTTAGFRVTPELYQQVLREVGEG